MASALGETMRAAAYHSNTGAMSRDIATTDSWPLPKNAKNLPKDHALVRVAYASLNPSDFKLPAIPLVGRYIYPKGIPGVDFAGTIVESTLPDLAPGKFVFGMTAPMTVGTLGEYVVIPKDCCVPVPDGLDLKDAATLPAAALTAYQTLEPYVKSGDKVFINGGSGGVGTFGIQIAKTLGCHVIVTCSGPNVELCQSLGADEVIDYRTENVVHALTRKGQQFDHIVDNVFSNADIYWSSHLYLKPESHYVTVAASFTVSVFRDFASIFLWPTTLGGGKRKFKFLTCWPDHESFVRLARWVVEGKMKPVIEREYDLDQTNEAFAHLKTGRTRGKLVVKVI